ncbi:condensation domain-containing protein [Kitasatospora herbaricolor]|uniref:Condensation domain-containing protein n=1 Tax=Kitasatospora herbaricolor TaxID=68217 RepID=A0ABZ1WJ03_9ACTN|nr:condensation domain-containing protein [Kitasatospora herbaricolor]
MSTTRQLEIGLSSGRSGTGPATWGQQAIWDTVRGLGPADAPRYNVSLAAPVDPGVPLAPVLDALGQLLELHDSLHTRLSQDDDGRLRQTVDGDGRLTVHVRECADGEEVTAAGRQQLAELAGQPFDVAREWPVRVGLVESGGQVRHLAFVLSHTAADAWGLRRLATDLTAIVLGDTPQALGERFPALQPLDEAAFQAGDRGRRRDANARQHWQRKLALGPERLFPLPALAGTPAAPFPNALLNSSALARAVPMVAAEHRVSPSSVLLAAASAMTARLTGAPDALLQVVVNNRFLPGLAHAVSTVAAEGLFRLPDAGGEFTDVLRRTHAASIATYRSAYYDKRLLDQDIADLAERDGVVADRSCFFNDTRDLMPAEPDPERGPAAGPLDRERSRTTLSWPVEFAPRANVSYALDAVQAPGALELSMTADGAVLPRPDMERFLYGMEELVVEAALAPGAR